MTEEKAEKRGNPLRNVSLTEIESTIAEALAQLLDSPKVEVEINNVSFGDKHRYFSDFGSKEDKFQERVTFSVKLKADYIRECSYDLDSLD